MPGLVPGIHVLSASMQGKTWMAGTSPAMTERRIAMDLRFTDEEIAFRKEVRAFFDSALPKDIRTKMDEGRALAKDDIVRWQRILNAKGWAVPFWPVEYGGTGWSPMQ